MSYKKLLPVLLLVFVVVSSHFSWAKSIENDSNSDETSSNEVIPKETKKSSGNDIAKTDEFDLQLSPKDQLLYFTLMAFRDISQHYVEHAANISENLLKDDDLKPNDSVILQEFHKNITEFMERFKKYVDLDELFNLVDLYSNTTSHYFELPKESATSDMLTIEAKLKKYGSDDLDREFENQFMAFVDTFYVRFDEFKAQLSKEELLKEKAMLEWLEDFKPIQDAEKKIISFEKFFRFYDE